MQVFIILIALWVGIGDDGTKKGRKGNESYKNQQHAEAANFYKEGIDSISESKPGRILAGLWNNLGSSLFRLGDFDQARQAFSNALSLASTNEEVSHFAYNAGNTTYNAAQNAQQAAPGSAPPSTSAPGSGGSGLQEALEYYKQALLADPENDDAKFNYEFVKRQLEEQEQNEDQQEQEQNEDQEQQDQQNDQEQEQQQNQDQEQEQNQNQQQQEQEQEQNQEQQQQQEQEQQQQQQQSEPDPTKLSREEAERILQALQNEEEELLRQVMKPQNRPKKVEKDW